jgi:hypothetical protein
MERNAQLPVQPDSNPRMWVDSCARVFRREGHSLNACLNIIINLSAWFKNEEPNANAGESDHAKRNKKCLHGLHLKRFPVVEDDSVPADGINCP